MVLVRTAIFLLAYNIITMIVYYGQQKGQNLINPVMEMPENAKKPKNCKLLLHILMAMPYIMYYWYKRKKDLPGSETGKLDRSNSSFRKSRQPFLFWMNHVNFVFIIFAISLNLVVVFPNNLMDEILTFVVEPLPSGGYVVLNRPWAFVQWLEKNPIKLANIDPTGNSPVIIKKPQLDRATGNKFILHHTYGIEYSMKGKHGDWGFDKRRCLDGPPPRNLTLPPQGVPESVIFFYSTSLKLIRRTGNNIFFFMNNAFN
ncbi:hypothetical protein ACJIZ3_023814 [Penstemon smallii]|uniref:Hydroxyproline O-arabinosyltransferase-like domain-containing protein n=1 Tax=Penstemon smallii TaxID=265156 RepID=A0ABD3TT60_9LAMI